MGEYTKNIVTFIRDPARSKNYALGPDIYSRAASHYIQELEDCRSIWDLGSHHDEAILLTSLSCDDHGIWSFDIPEDEKIGLGRRFFFLLGHLTYFLHRAGTLPLLIERCRKEVISYGPLMDRFPNRTRLAKEAMMVYLDRMEQLETW